MEPRARSSPQQTRAPLASRGRAWTKGRGRLATAGRGRAPPILRANAPPGAHRRRRRAHLGNTGRRAPASRFESAPESSTIICSGGGPFAGRASSKSASPSSPFSVQHRHPESSCTFLRLALSEATLMSSPSRPSGPSSFTRTASRGPMSGSRMSLCSSVVLPAPRNPPISNTPTGGNFFESVPDMVATVNVARAQRLRPPRPAPRLR